MRKLAILSTALLSLAMTHSAMAQANAAPQPGMPPGFANGSPNAQPPSATGGISTTQVGPAVSAPVPYSSMSATPPVTTRSTRRARRARARAHRRAMHRMTAPAAAPAQ